MVQVDLHKAVCNLQHFAEETLTVFVLKGKDSIDEHVIVIEMTIDGEDFSFQVHHALVLVVTICLIL